MFFFFGICVSPGPHGSNTLDADWEEHQAPSTPVRKLFTGLSRRKALRIDMSVSAEKTAGTTLFTVLTHTSNIYIFKLSLRWKLLQTHCYSDNKEPRWGGMPWDCSALAQNCVTSQMPQPLGSCSYLQQAQDGRSWPPQSTACEAPQVPKATRADPMGATPQTWMQMSQLRSRNQAAQPQGFVPEHHGQPCFWPRAGKTASPYSSGRCHLWLGCPQEQIPQFQRGLFAGAEPLRVCCPMGSLPAQLHLVWEAKQPAHLSLQPFPRNYQHFFSPNQSKTLPQTLSVKQNHTWAGIWGLTQSFQQVFPQDSPSQGFWRHHHS